MAAKMCGSSCWWQLEVLLTQIAQQAELRAQPEIMRLMTVSLFVWFSLHTGGTTCPDA